MYIPTKSEPPPHQMTPPRSMGMSTSLQAFEGKIVSPRNEAASLGALLTGLRRKLATLGGSTGRQGAGVAEDEKVVAALEEELGRQQQRHREGDGSKEGRQGTGNEDRDDGRVDAAAGAAVLCAEHAAATKSLRRKIAAARVRSEERAVVADAIAALDASLRELRSAASAGVAAMASFETLDSRC